MATPEAPVSTEDQSNSETTPSNAEREPIATRSADLWLEEDR